MFEEKINNLSHIYDPKDLEQQRAKRDGVSIAPKFESKIQLSPEIIPLENEMAENRNHFHRAPELAFKEFDTSKHVAQLLRSYNDSSLQVVEGIGRTGVVATIYGKGPQSPAFREHCIMLRADMDGLPIQEVRTERNKLYCSERPNVMHACGHDGHMAILLAVAKVTSSRAFIAKLPSNLCVKFCFQPAEESEGGAKEMIRDGVLDSNSKTGPHVNEVFGLHLWSYMPLGMIGTRTGPFMAASDRFYITVKLRFFLCFAELKGQGGHGAVPDGTKDAIICASHLVTQLQTIVSRNVSPLDSAVVTVGTFNAGYTVNIIADRADLSGTVRSLKGSVQDVLQKRISEICAGVGKTYDCEVALKYLYGYPATVNGPKRSVEAILSAASQVVGSDQGAVREDWDPTMGAEDFSFFLNCRPGCFFFVGACYGSDLNAFPHHKSSFDFDLRALSVGASVFLRLIENSPARLEHDASAVEKK